MHLKKTARKPKQRDALKLKMEKRHPIATGLTTYATSHPARTRGFSMFGKKETKSQKIMLNTSTTHVSQTAKQGNTQYSQSDLVSVNTNRYTKSHGLVEMARPIRVRLRITRSNPQHKTRVSKRQCQRAARVMPGRHDPIYKEVPDAVYL